MKEGLLSILIETQTATAMPVHSQNWTKHYWNMHECGKSWQNDKNEMKMPFPVFINLVNLTQKRVKDEKGSRCWLFLYRHRLSFSLICAAGIIRLPRTVLRVMQNTSLLSSSGASIWLCIISLLAQATSLMCQYGANSAAFKHTACNCVTI